VAGNKKSFPQLVPGQTTKIKNQKKKWVSKEKTKWKVDKGWHCRAELVGGKVF